jgi:putative serine/threonine protein kinase
MEIKNLEFLAKGKRSKVYTGKIGNKKVAVKVGSRAKLESKWLKLLNKHKIGPKFVKVSKEKLIYEFVEGKRIGECLNKKVVKKVLEQCRILDKLKIDKKEMTNPYKHILVNKGKVVMIDFERCHKVKRGKNVTQFGEYIMRKKLISRSKFTKLLIEYKKEQNDKNFKKIFSFLV